MVKLKTWRRPQTETQQELTAAAARVDLRDPTDRRYLDRAAAASKNYTAQFWRYWENLGEIQGPVGRSARVAGYAEFLVQRRDDDGTWHRVTDGPYVELMSDLYSPYDGTRGFVERYYTLMKIPADAWLIRVIEDGEFVGYQFLSTDEMDTTDITAYPVRPQIDGIRWITMPAGGHSDDRLVREVEPEDVLGRVWKPSPRYVELPQSPLASLRTEAEVLIELTKSIKGRINSRFALAGLLALPNTLAEARVAGRRGPAANESTLDYLSKAMYENVTDRESAAAVAPILATMAATDTQAINFIEMNRSIDSADLQLRAELQGRLLFGMDEPQSASQSSEQSHWGAWNAQDEERRIAVQPEMELLDFSITKLILHPQMEDDGVSDEEILRHRVWHNLDRSSVRTNAQEDTRQAHDRLVANGVALARRTGLEIDEVLDPQSDEYIRAVGMKTNNARLATFGVKKAEDIPDDWFKAPATKTGPPETSPGDDGVVGPGVGDPGSPNDSKREGPKRAAPV